MAGRSCKDAARWEGQKRKPCGSGMGKAALLPILPMQQPGRPGRARIIHPQTCMLNIPFQTLDWASAEKTEHSGASGTATWQTLEFEGLRIRVVVYSAGYAADHWCRKGHIVHCLEGAFVTELSTGENVVLHAGDTFVVSDDLSSHRSASEHGARLLIIDGDFLKSTQPHLLER